MSIDQYPRQPIKEAASLVSERILIPAPGDLAQMLFKTQLVAGTDAYMRLLDPVGGVETLRIGSSTPGVGFSLIDLNSDGTIGVDGQLLANDGLSSLPSYSFALSPNTGMYLAGTSLAFVSQGQLGYWITSTGRVRLAVDGTATTPALGFSTNTGTGMWYATAGGLPALCFSVDGALIAWCRADLNTLHISGHPTTTATTNMHMTTSGSIYRSTSSGEAKRDVMPLGGSVVDRLRPVTYKAKPEHVTEDADPEQEYVGFIAEEVAAADERLGQYDESGKAVYFDTNGLMAHMVAEVQSLRQRVASLEAKVDRLLSAPE